MYLKEEALKKILKNKKLLEEKLDIKLKAEKNNLHIFGDELSIFVAEKVFQAIEKNFPLNVALLLIDENYVLEEIPIKQITHKKPSIIRARIIGTKGKTLRVFTELSDCYIQLNDNVVSILGPIEKIKEAYTAIKSLILGSKQSNVYKYLEKHRKKFNDIDLGLKESKVLKDN